MTPGSSWTVNTLATNYFTAGGGIPSWRHSGSNSEQGLFSIRYQIGNGIELWSETENELIATSLTDGDGNAIHFCMGAEEAMTYDEIPQVSKQALTAGEQPDLTFAPDISNQSISVYEGDAFTHTIALDAGSDIVSMYGETDAPSWAILSQTTGQFVGTAPAFNGSSDSYVINCKAANAIGGIKNFTVTINVTGYASTNTKSLKFPNGNSTSLQGLASNVTALQRAGNGTGAGDAWSISMWIKPSTISNSQTYFYYGDNDTANAGRIEISQFSGANVMFRYGSTQNNITWFGIGNFPTNQWNHILITYDGGTTGNAAADITQYVARFSMTVNGVYGSNQIQHANYGWSGAIPADNFRIGRLVGAPTQQYVSDGMVNQIAIWDTDQSANKATIYNSGATQDLSALSAPPVHYYEMENSVTTITDSIGSANLTAYNFVAADLVTDTP